MSLPADNADDKVRAQHEAVSPTQRRLVSQPLHQLREFLRVEQFHQTVMHPLLHCLDGGIHRRVGCHQDGHKVRLSLFCLAEYLQAVRARHLQIYQHDAIGVSCQRIERPLTLPVLSQPRSAISAGRRSVTVVPSPTRLSTTIVPSCFSMIP